MKRFTHLLVSCLVLAASSSPVYAEETFEKIAFMGDNVEINDTPIGWNATEPTVVEINPATGKFEFTARFTRQRSLWQMYTDAIGENDWETLKKSIYTPNLYFAFAEMDPTPEDLYIVDGGVECFNIEYLPDAVGKTVPVYLDPDGGFWIGGGSNLTTNKKYKIEISADLSEMTIVSVETVEIKVDYPDNLYVIGNATAGGWDKATPMENLGDGIYQYEGTLIAGGALQIHAEDPAVCGFNAKAYGPSEPQTISSAGVSNGTLKYYETNRPDGCYYKVNDGETNDYILTVDLVNNSISVVVDNLYIVGVPTDWQFVKMERDGDRIYSYKGYFAAGSVFAFTTTPTWDTKVAPKNGDLSFGIAGFSDNSLSFGSPFTMKNTHAGYYIVSADMNSMTLSTRTYNPDPIEKLYVAINGNYDEMTDRGDGIYYWVGELNGNFTITTATAEYPCYMAAEASVDIPEDGIADCEMVFNTIAENGHNTWNNSNAGVYTVKVRPEAMTVSVEKGDTSAGITDIDVDEENTPVVYYDLTGRKVQNPTKGIYVKVQGSKVQKVVVR